MQLQLDLDAWDQIRDLHVQLHKGHPCYRVDGKWVRLSAKLFGRRITFLDGDSWNLKRENIALRGRAKDSIRSKHPGVYRRYNSWLAAPWIDGCRLFIGEFSSEQEAAQVSMAAYREYGTTPPT